MDEVDILALLLHKADARKLLTEDPVALCQRFQINETYLPFLSGLNREQLDEQALSLIQKRISEIRFFAPRSLKSLNDQLMEKFLSTNADLWPRGSNRHMLDANCFLKSLAEQRDPAVDYRELNSLRFQVRKRSIALYLLRPSLHHGWGIQCIWKVRSGYRYRYLCARTNVESLRRQPESCE